MDELITICKALGIESDQVAKAFTIWRFETLHVRGVDQLTSEDIYNYFGTIHPHTIEWLSNISCNVTFDSWTQACNALLATATALIVHKNQNPDSFAGGVVNMSIDLPVRSSDSLEIPVPPNYRYILGSENAKAKSIIIRFATINDRKVTTASKAPSIACNHPTLASDTYQDGHDNDSSKPFVVVDREPLVLHQHQHLNSSRFGRNDNSTIRMRMRADEEEQTQRKQMFRNRTYRLGRKDDEDDLRGNRLRSKARSNRFGSGRIAPILSRLGGAKQGVSSRQVFTTSSSSTAIKSKSKHIWRTSSSTINSNLSRNDLRAKLASREANVRIRVSYEDW